MAVVKSIYRNNVQIFHLFSDNHPDVVALARASGSLDEFLDRLKGYLEDFKLAISDKQCDAMRAADDILTLLEFNDTTVEEFSKSSSFHTKTITHLWELLQQRDSFSVSSDLYIDLYHQFARLKSAEPQRPSEQSLRRSMDRWSSGLKGDIVAVREANKERIIDKLIARIERHQSSNARYHFADDLSYDQKRGLVNTWWDTSAFQLAMAVKSPQALNSYLDESLSDEKMTLLELAKRKGMPFFVTPYYLSLLATRKEYDDAAIRSYVLYSPELVEAYGTIRAWEREDTIEAGKPNAAGWLLPDGHNVHRRYPEVAILIPDTMGRACGGLCASCQRMYDFQSLRFNFDLEALKTKECWAKRLEQLMHYFENDTQIRDILITGGDAFMSRNATLRNILEAVYAMAERKRKANKSRKDGEKYAELQRVRLGSRLLAYLPMRIDAELVSILKEFKQKASLIGIKQFIVQTHFQTPLEITPDAKLAIEAILSAGWTITNQLVYTVAVSRRGHTAKLRRMLNRMGVVCYYTFSVKGFEENYALFTPASRSMQEQREEKSYGLMSDSQQSELYSLITSDEPSGRRLEHFLRSHHLPFAATDRNVLNLPAIGKSMTFKTVGITDQGRRLLRFEHDKTRRHSPIIDEISSVYIVENKSVAAYLRQIELMGEDSKEYASIWSYMSGETEPRFELYRYPDFDFKTTEHITNIEVE